MNNYGVDRKEWIRNLSVHLADRADDAPWLTAVRVGGESVTFGDLVDSLHGYRRVVDAEFMSVESAVTAAVMHNMPGLSEMPPRDLARSMQEIVKWLGRDLPAAPATLRSVV
ncbi:hypothetical protein [Gordonia hydrophobica]|uniref:Uncharacterized protein n=1 Tax=Gordonia hydrophobica TaxID=40516 RepID=A0ABZ2TXJ4_9ACTN|nr:hypothetical protein [Gordonia hydrophobica]MBM7369278.1 hypothetical protein [Gordonia hydrophobica]